MYHYQYQYLHKILGADEPIPLLIKHPEGLSDVSLDVRVLELPAGIVACHGQK